MPIYEYKCSECGKHLEVIQKFSDEPLSVCPDCSGSLQKQISNTSFVLKGTGWYVTDYASKDRKSAVEAEKKAQDKGGGSKKKDGKAEKNSGGEKPSSSGKQNAA